MNAFAAVEAPIVLAVVVTGVVLAWMPGLTRPDLFFAITVRPGFRDSEEGCEIVQQYRWRVGAATVAGLAVTGVGAAKGALPFFVGGWVIQDVGCLAAYFAARKRVGPHAEQPTPVREAALAQRPSMSVWGWVAQAVPLFAMAATAAYLNSRWADIPERFPIHWGLDGRPNGWSLRTPAGVYAPLLAGAFICVMLAVMGQGVLRWSRSIHVGGTLGKAEDEFRRTMAWNMVAAQYLVMGLMCWAALLPLEMVHSGPPGVWGVLGVTLVFVVVVTGRLIRMGQGGMRGKSYLMRGGARENRRPVGDRTEDRHWKAGFIYVNPDDPALFVEKRFGIGYTLNLGRGGSWMLLGGLLLLPLLSAAVIHIAGE
jgi:uncharacterized membrane protein